MPTVNAPKPSSTVATALCVTVAVVMPVFLFGGLAVQITDELHMGVGAIGLIAGLYFAVCGLTAVPAGRCVERFGVPFAARLAVGLTAGSMLAIAAAAHDPVVLTALLLLSAPANGLGQIAANTVLADWAPKRRKGMLFGAKQAAVPLCTMLGGLSVPAVALTFGWRWAFVAAAAFALLALVPVAGLGPLAPHGRRGGDGRGADRRLLVLAVAVCLGSGAANPLGSFLTTYAVDIGASEAFAGLNLTVGGLAGVIARVAVGAIADRRGGELGLITVMLLGGAAGIATFTVCLLYTS
ncbi:MFS transporter, partial [Glycomyces tenuis]|uniref:MFS transporter n=1 Tax=Glycomyces tenuis TaxID=58116 RepID=UPI00068D2070